MINESTNIRETTNIALGANDSFWIKRFFLSFLQAFFQENTKYNWSSNDNTTSINIYDKFAMDLGQIQLRPSIVISRGYMRWMQSNIGQKYSIDLFSGNTVYTDLLASSVTINCMAKNGLVCEELALIVRNALTVFKEQLRANGLHRISNITVGEERTLSVTSDIELTVVPVSVEFTKQSFLGMIEDYYTINTKISFDGTTYGGYSGHIFEDTTFPMQVYENRDYTVFASGLIFVSGYAPPIGSTLSVSYIEAASLSEVLDETPIGTVDGINRQFYVSQEIYGYSPLLSGITISGLTSS